MKKKTTISSKLKAGWLKGYRSGLEEIFGEELRAASLPFIFEGMKIKYLKPAKEHSYTPDFTFTGSNIIIETKGRFVTADRQKHLLIQAQHPELDIRFIFSNPNTRISKLSKTTYAMWCERYGFKYAKQSIPKSWVTEIKAQIKLQGK